MRTDGQTDMTKLIVASRNFANVPEDGLQRAVHQPSVRFSSEAGFV